MGKDFRVGDIVCDITQGTGEVTKTGEYGFWSVVVQFDTSIAEYVTYSDYGFRDVNDRYPVLFHGTWVDIFGNLPEIKPKRTKKMYLNVWLGKLGIACCCLYDSEAKAIYAKHAHQSEVTSAYIKTAEEVEVEE